MKSYQPIKASQRMDKAFRKCPCCGKFMRITGHAEMSFNKPYGESQPESYVDMWSCDSCGYNEE